MKPIRIIMSPTRSRPLNMLLGATLVVAAALLLLSLASYHASDASMNTSTALKGPHSIHNLVGAFGASTSDLLFQFLGLTAFALPLWLGGLGWDWVRSRGHSGRRGSAWLRWTGVLMALAFVPAVFGMLPWHWRWLHVMPIEGVVGRLMADLLMSSLNLTGAAIVAAVMAALGLYVGSSFSFRAAWEWSQERSIQLTAWHDRYRNWQADRADQKAEREAIRKAEMGLELDSEAEDDAFEEEYKKPGLFARMFGFLRRKPREDEDLLDDVPAFQRMASRADEEEDAARPGLKPNSLKPNIWERREVAEVGPGPLPVSYAAQPIAEPELDIVPISSRVSNAPAKVPTGDVIAMPGMPFRGRAKEAAEEAAAERARFAEEMAAEGEEEFDDFAASMPAASLAAVPGARLRPVPAPAAEALPIHERADADLRTTTVAPKNVSGFKLPPSTLLTKGEEPLAIREDLLREEARKLVEKCAEFRVNGQVVQINPGPMVTTYEFKPDASVKYSRVAGLGDDLCLAMRAESILIERMAGTSHIGVQVPNHDRETIHLRDVIESETFAKAKSRLTLAMGKDINGRIVTADLAGMPHVLIAGSTGSGKSVAINAMIMSLLFRTTPAQVRLILVDPKRVELGMYEGIPHLFTPIITEAKLAANALRNAVREMERRLKLLASRSVRNIDQYNAKLADSGMESLFTETGEAEEPLPFIVIIIDELADLMMLDRANVEESITRLAQMARAVGIHLVLATQRPSVDVITGLIKANVPTRISFRLASKVDSRTIIDDNGAESLLGRGDMLFRPPGTSRLMRLHAPYVSETETAAVVDFWKAQGEAEYVEGFLEAPREERAAGDGTGAAEDDNDELFDDAVRLVFEFGKASTSLLQRRLRVGYGRAAHLIDLMERDGLVGAADGTRPRELLKHPGWLHEVPAAID
jgi:DNA segregation ATPase FtsK/SpoIIIE, S-DNA-T family